MRLSNTFIATGLGIAFIGYSLLLYTSPASIPQRQESYNAELADTGKMLWQANNCHTCHQVYGLGGYLGPDLTNVAAHPGGEKYLRGIIRSGIRQMPGFVFTDSELDAILEFLKSTHASGLADPRNFDISPTGNIYPKAHVATPVP